MLDDGRKVDVHKFDTKADAERYLTTGRRYRFERHETWGFTRGIDFYQGPNPGERAALRDKKEQGRTIWQAVFWA